MKIVSFSTLILILTSVFSSCSKDLGNSSSADDANSIAGVQVASNGVVSTKKPVLTPSQDPAPVNKGNSVTIRYSAADATSGAAVQCGRIKIYQWLAGTWTEVASGTAPTVSFTLQTLTADDCAYKFRAGFDPGGTNQCRGSYTGVDYLLGQEFCVDVVEPCVDVFTIDGHTEAKDLQNGLYEFTITYTLTSPVDVEGVKFQGGATAGGKTGHAITDVGDFEYVNINNNNTVLKWVGDLKACTPKVLSFKYTRNFSCPADGALVTGDWSASTVAGELGVIAKLPYNCE
jgi:hypothetical protein